jgi:tRNA(Ile)-lysidine synthase
MIRGKSANEDEEFCRKLSLNLNVNFLSIRKNVKLLAEKHKISLEEAGRYIRYKEFEKALKNIGFLNIATAHNSCDNAETVLLNLIKGSGLKGISGIPPRRGNIIRPILNISKNEILDYLDRYGIKYRTDESNLNTDFERNFLRHEIIPLIKKKLNPQFENTIFHFSEVLAGIGGYIDKKIKEKLNEIIEYKNEELKILIPKSNLIDEELKSYLIKSAVEECFKIQLTFADIKNITSLFKKGAGKKVNISNNLVVIRERNFILISPPHRVEKFEDLSIKEGDNVKVNGKNLSIKKLSGNSFTFTPDKLREYISADSLSGSFQLRRWKHGEKFFPFGLKGSKKISDFLNEQKIPSSEKHKQLVLTEGEKVVWILGLRLDERFKVTNDTKKVIELCLK